MSYSIYHAELVVQMTAPHISYIVSFHDLLCFTCFGLICGYYSSDYFGLH